jgi:hypothetical protein
LNISGTNRISYDWESSSRWYMGNVTELSSCCIMDDTPGESLWRLQYRELSLGVPSLAYQLSLWQGIFQTLPKITALLKIYYIIWGLISCRHQLFFSSAKLLIQITLFSSAKFLIQITLQTAVAISCCLET